MKIISNNVAFDDYIWDDPGDYPNGIAGSALPSYPVCDFSGDIVLEAENDEELKDFETIDDWFNDWAYDGSDSPLNVPSGWYIRWKFVQVGNQITATPYEAEPRDDYPDYDDRW